MLTLAVYNSTPERNKSVYVYLTIFKISRFMEDVSKQRRNFISLSELEYGPLKFSFRRVRLQLTK